MNNDNAGNRLQAALEHHLAGRLDAADAIYRELQGMEPVNPDVLHLSGEIACQRGRYGEAVKLLLHAIGINPAVSAYHLNLGRAYKGLGRQDEAVASYRRALAGNANDAAANNSLGNIYYEQGQLDESIACYRAAIALAPELAEVHCNLGNALNAGARLVEAAQSYFRAIELKPQADIYNKLGNVLSLLDKPDDARICFETALSMDPGFAEAYSNLGNVLQDQGDVDGAVARYRQALALKPDFAEAYNNLGNALRQQGQLGEAALCFQRALSLSPAYAEAYSNLGNVLKDEGGMEAAIASYRKAVALAPDAARLHFNLGVALMEAGQLAPATESYLQAIALKKDYKEAYCNLGVTLKERGRFDDAITCFKAALEVAPDFVDARCNLADMYALTRQPELAETWYRKTLEIAPGLVSAHANLSALLAQDGRLEEAKQHRDQAYRRQNLFVTRSPLAVRDVLMLFDAGRGNVPFSFLFPARRNNLIEWMIEYASDEQFMHLPHYDVVFNAIGDPDAAGPVAAQLGRFEGLYQKPLLNSPRAVARTARHLMPKLFAGLEGLVIPPVWRVEQTGAWFDNPEFAFPLLVRPLGSQGGEGLIRVEDRASLADIEPDRLKMVHLCGYRDYRSSDGYFRKYRVIFVDRTPYPYHLAISEQWMVHYHSANMLEAPWKLEEERRFLEDPQGVLGARGMALIEAIGKRLDLDYGGVDFSILPDGRMLVFEANATMLAHPEYDEVLKFKNPYIQRIFDAFEVLLAQRSGKGVSGV